MRMDGELWRIHWSEQSLSTGPEETRSKERRGGPAGRRFRYTRLEDLFHRIEFPLCGQAVQRGRRSRDSYSLCSLTSMSGCPVAPG